MKVYAQYDLAGNIRSLVSVNAPEGAGMMLAPGPGVLVAEVDDPEIRAVALDLEKLAKVAKDYKVTTPISRCKIAPKR